MTNLNLLILGAVAFVMVLISFLVGGADRSVEISFKSGRELVADFDPGRVDTIEIRKGEDRATLKRSGARSFQVEELNYPASNKEVNSLFNQIVDIKLAAEVTTDEAMRAELNVAEAGAKTTSVRLLDTEGKEVLGLLLGESNDEEGSGTFHVRLASDAQIYKTEGWVSFRTKPLDFIEKQLLNLERTEVAKIVVGPKDGTVYTIANPEAGPVELQNVPEGKKVKSGEPDSVLGATSYLSVTDVKPSSAMEDVEFASKYTVTTRTGAEYELSIGQQDEKWYVLGKARYTGPDLRSLTVTRGAEGEKADEEVAKNQGYIDAATAVEAFTQMHQGWVYEIADWKVKSMTKSFDDLLEVDDGKPTEVAASHILIPYQGAERAAEDVTRTKEEAKALAADLLQQVLADPTQFETLARDNSSCPSAEKGGDLGTFKFDAMAVPFSEAAFALEVDEICKDVVETGFGYHVIKRTK